MRPNVHCPVCGGSARELFPVPDWIDGRRTFHLQRCAVCALAFVHPIPGERERAEFRGSEQHYYGIVDAHRAEFVREAEHLLDRIGTTRPPPGRLLDVGCGRGHLLAAATSRGWQAVGVERAPEICESLRRQGLEIVEGDFGHVPLPAASFDVVLLQQVVEHSADPAALLGRARRALRADGLLYVATPNGAGLLARTRGPKFSYWIPPEHVFHYSPQSLRVVLERNGFDVVRLSTAFCVSPVTNDLRDISRYHAWFRRIPRRLSRLLLRRLRPFLERRGEGTILEVLARPARP